MYILRRKTYGTKNPQDIKTKIRLLIKFCKLSGFFKFQYNAVNLFVSNLTHVIYKNSVLQHAKFVPLNQLLNDFNEVIQWKIKDKKNVVVTVIYKKIDLFRTVLLKNLKGLFVATFR